MRPLDLSKIKISHKDDVLEHCRLIDEFRVKVNFTSSRESLCRWSITLSITLFIVMFFVSSKMETWEPMISYGAPLISWLLFGVIGLFIFEDYFILDTRQRLLHKITKTKFPNITNRRTVLNFDDIKYITINGKVARKGKHDQHLSHQCVVCLIDHQDKIIELTEWSSLDGIYRWNTTNQEYLVDSKILKSSINFAKFIAKITNVELMQYPISGGKLVISNSGPSFEPLIDDPTTRTIRTIKII